MVWGEIWRAVSKDKIVKGDQVRILSVKGLLLTVAKINALNEEKE
jgi:membrane-bound ClpP family serine protease